AAINGFLAGHGIAVPEDDTATPAADVTAVEAPAPVAAQPEEVEPPVREEITPQQPVPVEDAMPLPPPERDEELVGIFLEEADEILESAGTSLESWMEAPDNLIEVQSLQRDLHTLKGGARMAEIPELGDLGHELENLYEGLALGNLKPSPVLFQLLQACHDRLAAMVEGVKADQGLARGNDLIAAIHVYLADPAGLVLPAVHGAAAAAPATTPVSPAGTAPASAAPDEDIPADVDPDILNIFVEEA